MANFYPKIYNLLLYEQKKKKKEEGVGNHNFQIFGSIVFFFF